MKTARLLPVMLLLAAAHCPAEESLRQVGSVTRVIDGDTVVVLLDGRPTTIRLIGVDCPESVGARKPVERFAREASEFLRGLIEGKTVRLAYEPEGARLEKYGRMLAYLYLEPGGKMINREIIAKGFGFAYVKYPFGFMDDFRQAERQAREAKRGLWGPDPPPEKVTAETIVYVTATGTKYHRVGCRALAKSATVITLGQVGDRLGSAVCDPPKLP